jgi:tetratricopeptide (TPR) repeat protein
VLEGSVQKLGNKLRINAKLVDAVSGHHIWAERYDRDLKDLFAVQTEIVQTIVTTLGVKIHAVEMARVKGKGTSSLEAYDYLMRGWEYYARRTRATHNDVRRMFEKAIEVDPNFASAYAALGEYYRRTVSYGWTEFNDKALQKAEDLARTAIMLDDASSSAHRVLGRVYLRQGQYNLAVSELQRALELNPNDAISRMTLGAVMLYSGERVDEAIDLMKSSLRFDPKESPGNYMELAIAQYLNGEYVEAITTLERGTVLWPDFAGYSIVFAAAYAQTGRTAEAEQAARNYLRQDPFFELDSYGSAFRNPNDRAKVIDGLRKAGFK